MEFNTEKMETAFNAEWENLQRKVQKPGILLAGFTGAGKSSLANMIFGQDVFKTGIGKPMTQSIQSFETDSVIIYDTKGCETGGIEEFKEYVLSYAQKEGQVQFNIAWYCVQCAGKRVTDLDLSVIKEILSAGIPVAVVFTKVDSVSDEDVKAMKKVIEDDVRTPIFETSTFMNEYNQAKALVEWSIKKLPEQLSVAFIKQQTINFAEKKKRAEEIIAKSVTAAGIIGVSPIPFSDAPLLAINEMRLMSQILNLYNMGDFASSLKSMGLGGVMSLLGRTTAKTLIANITKFIPGFGTIVSGVIAAGVATSFTWAFGMAVCSSAEKLWEAKLKGNNAEAEIENIIKNFGEILTEETKANLDS